MNTNPRRFLHLLLTFASLLVAFPTALSVAADDKAGVSPDEALTRLKDGNLRFIKGGRRPINLTQERNALVKGQQPYAIVLSCSDSRVPPEIIFDETLGKLFVVRVAGNVADPITLGSVEYAVEHLGAKLIMVLGHQSCGAVKATLDGGHAPPNIEALLHLIQPAVDKAKAQHLDPAATFDAAIVENVRLQMHQAVEKSEVLHEVVEKKQVRIVGAVYSLVTGQVEMLPAAAVAHK
jgi:carbonic anhydrase